MICQIKHIAIVHILTFIKRNRLLSLAMADKDYAPLSTACVRALNDRFVFSDYIFLKILSSWGTNFSTSCSYINFAFVVVQNVREAKSSCFGDWKDGEGLRLCRQHQPDQKAAQGDSSANTNTNANEACHKKYNIIRLSMMQVLGSEFAISQNPHMRKGGLIGLCTNKVNIKTDAAKLQGLRPWQLVLGRRRATTLLNLSPLFWPVSQVCWWWRTNLMLDADDGQHFTMLTAV